MAIAAIPDIGIRRNGDSRQLTAPHVVDMDESIAVLGLLKIILVDTGGHLLAGGHRHSALQILAEPRPIARRAAFLLPIDRIRWRSTRCALRRNERRADR